MFTPQTRSTTDAIATALTWVSRVSLVAAIALIPLAVIPLATVPILEGKALIVIALLAISFVSGALWLLRVGTFDIPASATIGAAWLVLAASLVSAGLSGDAADSLYSFSTNSYGVGVIALCVAVVTLTALAAQSIKTARLVLGGMCVSAAVLLVWHAVRLWTGLGLSFGLFPQQTATPLGNWLDVAILGAALVFALLFAAARPTLPVSFRWSLLVVLLAVVSVLLVINNTVLWSILGIISLTVVVMTITRRQPEATPSMLQASKSSQHGIVLTFASVVFIASLIALFGGGNLNATLTQVTDSTFVEVRPSVSASLNIITNVWSENLLTGVGPARYADAWRVHKSETINQTIFWDTNFASGQSFILTHAVETGLLGLLTWGALLVLFVISGVRTLVLNQGTAHDPRYGIAFISFVLALFLWSTTLYAFPGVSIMLLAFALTGVFIGTSLSLRPRHITSVSLINNQKVGFVVVASAVVCIIATVWLLQQMIEHTIAGATRAQALTTNGITIEELDGALGESFALRQDDNTARTLAIAHLVRMQQLALNPEPTAEDQQAFSRSVTAAVNAATLATNLDSTNPENWYTQVRIYGLLIQAGIEGALERAEIALEQARALDPKSPRPDFLAAELALISGNAEGARSAVAASIQKKRDYRPALLLLAQIEIADGNVAEAIAATESILSFEPTNAARWYQLGLLYQANNQAPEAIASLTEAVRLDEDYANALYIRGLLLSQQGETEAALNDLERVRTLNPDNEQVADQISIIANGGSVQEPDAGEPLDEAESETETDAETVSEAAAASELVTTTTTTPEESEEE